jgi:hypothetical protein
MTHDELLTKIDLFQRETTWDIPEESIRFGVSKKNYQALRAVVELHKPVESDYVKELLCRGCPTYAWPCKTIQAIEKELT